MRNNVDWKKVPLKKGILIVLATGGGLLWFFFRQDLSTAALEQHKEVLLSFARTHSVEAWLGWGVLYWMVTATGLPGAVFFSLMSGFLFGPVGGMALDLTFASLGATTALLLFRQVILSRIRGKIKETPHFKPILEGFSKNGLSYLLFLRLVPLFPFWIVNVALSLTEIRPMIFLGGTIIGMIPASALITRLGYSFRTQLQAPPFLTGEQKLLLGLLGILALLPVAIRRFSRMTGEGT